MGDVKFMRMICFFDIPVMTAEQRKIASRFRKHLLNNGYQMMQFSVYSKIVRNDCNVDTNIRYLKNSMLREGNVRVLTVTEKQYADIEIIIGTIKPQEKKVKSEQLSFW
ncbi:MAG: CRISPR-associated endonuclease Cas2 [Rickettsiales bacterium]|nr:MAG: CRISPR-associated endonuclease Cas2 [Rickettsiales bacterium]